MTKQAPKVKHRSEIAAAMHETMRGMHRLGLVDKQTMRDFGVRGFTAAELSGKQLRYEEKLPE
jgi:putative transcriptional regulator